MFVLQWCSPGELVSVMEHNSCYIVDGFYWDVDHGSWQGLVSMRLKSGRMRLNMGYMKELLRRRPHAFLTQELSSIVKCNCEYFVAIVL
jgi:hypothetical protein